MASYDGDPVLGDPEVDTAVIATSTDTHADLIHRAARCR
jgi:predicted dehydrogenase